MTNDCLVTKLKGIVDNGDLLKIGELRIKTNLQSTIKLGYSDTSRVVKNLTGNFISPSGVNEVTVGVVASMSEATSMTAGVDNIISIPEKYKLSYLEGTIRGINLDIKELDYMPNLIYALNMVLSGDTSELKNVNPNLRQLSFIACTANINIPQIVSLYPNLTIIRFSASTNVTGSIDDLGALTSLTGISLGDVSGAGSLEGFVAKQKISGKSESTGLGVSIIDGNYAPNTKFKDASISVGNAGLTWVSSGDNTVITFNNEQTTIHVNNDGTWTRVS